MTILVVFMVMLICFTVIGSILIRRLRLFFKSNYDKQRFSLLTALLLLIACLLTLAARYALEYAYLVHKMNMMPNSQQIPQSTSSSFAMILNMRPSLIESVGKTEGIDVPIFLVIIFIIVSDFGPIIA